MPNSAPTLSGLNQYVFVGEEAANLTPQLLDIDVSFSDLDNNFDGGALVLGGLTEYDLVGIRNQGVGAGQIGLSGGNVTFGGVVFGTVTGGAGVPLSVAFNAGANSVAIDALIQNLTYQSLSDTQQVANLTLVVTDAAGAPAVAPAPTPSADPFTEVMVASGPNGGYSAPSFGDVDGDGDLDLVVGGYDGTLSYYLNDGGVFTVQTGTYNPLNGTGNPFDAFVAGGLYSTPSLADLDGDGDLDLAVGAQGGTVRYFLNTDASPDHSAPVYEETFDLDNPLGAIDFGGLSYSAPSFADLDGDGDLDAVVGDGNALHYFRNDGTTTAPAFTELTGAENPFDAVNNQTGVTGAPAFVDLDRDGDLDAVAGSYNGEVTLLVNTGTSTAPSFAAIAGYDGGEGAPQPGNPFNGVDVGQWGVAAVADLDGNGLPEVVLGAQDGALHYFQNANQNGDPNVPVYAERAGAANPFNGISLPVAEWGDGSAAPAYVNIDGDGDLDLVVGDYYGAVHYYENTGSAVAPVYVERTGGANPFAAVNFDRYAAPAFADLDGDGDKDLIVGGIAMIDGGEGLSPHGILAYYENNDGVFTAGASNPFDGLISPYGGPLAPTFGDLDGDGDMDAVVGQGSSLIHLENTDITGNHSVPTFVVVAGGMGGGIGSLNVNSYAKPSLIDFDGDGDLDLAVGNRYGSLQYFENTANSASSFVEQTGGANPLGSINVGYYSAPTLVNLDGDPDLEVVVGAGDSTLHAFDATSGIRITVGLAMHDDGSPGDDVMHGQYATSQEYIYAGDGNDTVFGGGGINNLYGEGGNDSLVGGDEVDYLVGGLGDDTLNGGINAYIYDRDTARYSDATGGITVSLTNGDGTAQDGDGGIDTLISIEQIDGSAYADDVTVNGAVNGFFASLGDGNDTFHGGSGPDGTDPPANRVYGGAGDDALYGGANSDDLKGEDGNDLLSGGGGNDSLTGGAGDDTLDGGAAGSDWADFSGAGAGLTITLDAGTATVVDVTLGTDSLTGIENLAGTDYDDVLVGDDNDNVLSGGINGGLGDDSLVGGLGNDTLRGGFGADTLDGGSGFNTANFTDDWSGSFTIDLANGTAIRGTVTDTLFNIQSVVGSNSADSIVGASGNETFEGMAGSDSIDGGDGIDTVSYAGSQSGVVVQLDAGGNATPPYTGRASNDGWQNGPTSFGDDALINIENVTGSAFNDIIRGDAGNNVLSGLDGNDTMSGDAGNDTFIGGAGYDLLQFSDYLANNTITRAGDGSYTLVGPEGTDTLIGIEQVQFYGTGNYNGGTLNLTGATVDYEGLNNNAVIAFDPLVDTLRVNDPGMLATNFRFGLSGDQEGVFLTQLDPISRSVVKTVTLVFTPGTIDTTNVYKIAADMVRFASGSLLIVGDGTSATVDDDGGSDTHDGSAAADLMVSFGAGNTLNGGDGDDVLVTLGGGGGMSGGSGPNDVFNGGAGNDTLALDNVAGLTGYTVNLLAGNGSVAGANPSSFTVSFIENVEGSSAADTITGGDDANRLVGGGGNDSLSGGNGADTLVGGNGADTLVGGGGVDTADYSRDPDANADGFGVAVTIGSTQSSATNGTWQGASYSVTVTSSIGEATDGWGNVDKLGPVSGSIENVIGSAYNDVIFGNNGANYFYGGTGTDLLVGGAGNDTLDGGPAGDRNDSDWLSYKGATLEGVNVDLGAGTAVGRNAATGAGSVGSDTLLNIDGVVGSGLADSLVGGSDSTDFRGVKTEWFQGGIGVDTIDGGWTDVGGNGIMDADDYEINWARYDGVTGTVVVDLSAGAATNDGEGGSDYLNGINAVWGGTGDDTLTGGNTSFDYREFFNGGGGNDSITGGSGIDVILYRNSSTGINIAFDTVVGGNGGGSDGLGGVDTFSGIEGVVGSNSSDTITGGAGDQNIQGRQGNDGLTGGADIDTVSYDGDYDNNGDGFGVAVNLTGSAFGGSTSWQGFTIGALGANRALDGWGNTDTLSSFENITGSIYNDYLVGNGGNNAIDAGRGNDLVFGGDGNDTLDGGDGNDSLSYRSTGSSDLIHGVTVDLGAGTATDTFGNTDFVSNFETVVGSAYSDSLTGDPNVFSQFLSSDRVQVFEGREGADTIDGGTSAPSSLALASYTSSTSGIYVNLGMGWASDGFGSSTSQDQLRNIDGIIGSAQSDYIVGGSSSASIFASNLFEQFEGGLGNDTIDGGSGTDRVSYAGATGSVTVTLGEGMMPGSSSGAAGTDMLINIEHIRGSNYNDVLIGNSGNNAFEGRGGNDMIQGGAGFDTIRFDQSASAVQVQFSNETAGDGGAYDGGFSGFAVGVDMFSGIEAVRGSEFGDTFIGSDIAGETFEGMAGNDTINGGNGAFNDTASYSSSLIGITVSLSSGSATVANDGWGGTDSLSGIENVTGSHFDDVLTGDDGDNNLQGLDGNDTLTGGAGNDTIAGGFGNDTAVFSGAIGSYSINTVAGVTTVIGADGTDTVRGVEMLSFNGGADTMALGVSYDYGAVPDYAAFYFDPTRDVLNVTGLGPQDFEISPIEEEGPNQGRGLQLAQNDPATGNTIKTVTLLFTDTNELTNIFKVSTTNVIFTGGQLLLGDNTYGTGDDDSNLALTGGSGNDVLISVGGSQTLDGGLGNDHLISVGRLTAPTPGESGSDAFIGGDGNDTLGLDGMPGGPITQYSVDLTTGQGLIQGDYPSAFTVSGIENVEGSDVDDYIVGDSGANKLSGGWAGNDTLIGGDGNDSFEGGQGNDSIDGGAGTDRLDYSNIDGNSGGVTVDLGAETAVHGGYTDHIASIERVVGTWSNDTLTGDATDDAFEGRSGNDVIHGLGGNDTMRFDTSGFAINVSFDLVTAGMGTALDGWGGTDTFDGIEGVRGSDGNDTITGGFGDQTLEGMAGADFIDGGTGGQTAGDTVNYNSSLGGVMVNLSNHNALDSWGYTDAINNIENIRGSHFADNLIGDANNNAIWAQSGNDTIDGGAGMDTAQYSGLKSEYTVFKGVGYYTVTDNNAANGNDGVDTLYGIEKLQFSDGSTTFGTHQLTNDYNGDGKADLRWQHTDGTMGLWLMDGVNMTAATNIGPYPNWTVFDAQHDFNGDGKSDLLWKNTDGTASIWLMDGVNMTAAANFGPYAGWSMVDANGDYNGDGKADLRWQHTDGTMGLWLMDGVNMTAAVNIGPYANWSVFDNQHDFNGDGKSDLLWKNTDGTASIWLMDGVNMTAAANFGPYAGWSVVDANGDYNGDGKADLRWQHTDGTMGLWLMDGVNMTAAVNIGPYANWSVFDNQHDFNGDGKSDLLWKNTDGTASIWLMDGVNMTAAANFGPYAGWSVVDANGDYNGDGKADLRWQHTDGSVGLWLMDGVNMTASMNYGPYAGWSVKDDSTDANGDGKTDLTWTHTDGTASIWTMDGVTMTAAQNMGPYAGWSLT